MRVYKGGWQFSLVLDFKNDILTDWAQNLLIKLIESMPNLVFEVIKANGGLTK